MPFSEKQRRALYGIEGGSFKPQAGEPFHGISKRRAKKMLGEGKREGPTAGDAAKAMRRRKAR